MATEKRLIDANALYEKATRAWDDTLCDGCYSEIINLIDEAPTVDAAPVVRCKDCEHYGPCESCYVWKTDPNPDDFCSQGERRTDNA